MRVSIASPLTRRSPNGRRVGIRIVTFEACSGFTRVTVRQIAQPPQGDLCHEAPALPVAADWRPKNDWLTALTLAIRAMGLLCTSLLVVCVSGIARFAR